MQRASGISNAGCFSLIILYENEDEGFNEQKTVRKA